MRPDAISIESRIRTFSLRASAGRPSPASRVARPSLKARGAPTPLALARRLCASLGPQALSRVPRLSSSDNSYVGGRSRRARGGGQLVRTGRVAGALWQRYSREVASAAVEAFSGAQVES